MLYIKKLIAGLVVLGCAATAIVSCGHSAATSYLSDFNDTIYAPSEAGGFVIMGNKSHRSSIINVFVIGMHYVNDIKLTVSYPGETER